MMILPKPEDAIHKAWLYRLLSEIADNAFLVKYLRFKGGTCAAMLGLIDRFSIDLDFDLLETTEMPKIRSDLENIFKKLGLTIKDQSQNVPQYFLKYENKTGDRNTLKLDITFPPPKANEYESVRFNEIDRIIYCHTIPTMFANKLVAFIERFEKFGSIAGRDLYDIHTFYLKGYSYKQEIITERTGKSINEFMNILKSFIEKEVTQTIIDQDLNTLLPVKSFQKIRKVLKQEILMFLESR